MTPEVHTKRRRGGQPGNKNAKGNRGNLRARGRAGNRGGKGAPPCNQFARKRLTLAAELLREFQHCPEAVAWVRSHAERLRSLDVAEDSRLSFSVSRGLTPDALAEKGQEYRYGLYRNPESEESD